MKIVLFPLYFILRKIEYVCFSFFSFSYGFIFLLSFPTNYTSCLYEFSQFLYIYIYCKKYVFDCKNGLSMTTVPPMPRWLAAFWSAPRQRPWQQSYQHRGSIMHTRAHTKEIQCGMVKFKSQ